MQGMWIRVALVLALLVGGVQIAHWYAVTIQKAAVAHTLTPLGVHVVGIFAFVVMLGCVGVLVLALLWRKVS